MRLVRKGYVELGKVYVATSSPCLVALASLRSDPTYVGFDSTSLGLDRILLSGSDVADPF
jgi:hypothetical protein